jgi:hypothetical protein
MGAINRPLREKRVALQYMEYREVYRAVTPLYTPLFHVELFDWSFFAVILSLPIGYGCSLENLAEQHPKR